MNCRILDESSYPSRVELTWTNKRSVGESTMCWLRLKYCKIPWNWNGGGDHYWQILVHLGCVWMAWNFMPLCVSLYTSCIANTLAAGSRVQNALSLSHTKLTFLFLKKISRTESRRLRQGTKYKPRQNRGRNQAGAATPTADDEARELQFSRCFLVCFPLARSPCSSLCLSACLPLCLLSVHHFGITTKHLCWSPYYCNSWPILWTLILHCNLYISILCILIYSKHIPPTTVISSFSFNNTHTRIYKV